MAWKKPIDDRTANLIPKLLEKGVVIYDSFNRLDSNELGKADTRQDWQILSGTWGINSNVSTILTTSGITRALVDPGISNYALTVKLVAINGGVRIPVRLTDVSNELYVYAALGQGYTLYKRENNAASTLGTNAQAVVAGDVLKIEANGSTIKVYVNGILLINVTNTFNQSATKCGLSCDTANSKFDNFVVEVV